MKVGLHRMTGLLAVVGMVGASFGFATAAGAAVPKVLSVRTGASVFLANSGGIQTVVETLTISKGSWTISSNVTAVNFGSGDFIRCSLSGDGTAIDGGATTYLRTTVGDIANAATIKASGQVEISLACSHDANSTYANQFYVDPGATINAVNGGPINTVGTPKKATVVARRTTASTAVPEGSDTPVLSVPLTAGRWEVRANLSAVSFSGDGSADCFFSGNQIQGTADVGNEDDLVADVVLQGELDVGEASNETIECIASEANGMYVDAGATVIATLVAPADVVVGTDLTKVLSDTGGTQTKVFHEKVRAGDWRVSAIALAYIQNANNSIGGGTDFVRCTLLSGKQSIDGGATVRISDDDPDDYGNYVQDILNSGTFSTKKPWTLSLSCSHDTTVPTADAGAHWTITLVSPVIAIEQGPISSTVT